MDVVPKETRSRMMAGIRGKDTAPELVVRRFLFSSGFRFRLHRKDLPGKPDIVLPRHRTAILVHGCFWHAHEGCRFFRLPESNRDFWKAKLEGNRQRDREAVRKLVDAGWRVAVIWECAIRDEQAWKNIRHRIPTWIRNGRSTMIEYP